MGRPRLRDGLAPGCDQCVQASFGAISRVIDAIHGWHRPKFEWVDAFQAANVVPVFARI